MVKPTAMFPHNLKLYINTSASVLNLAFYQTMVVQCAPDIPPDIPPDSRILSYN